MNVFRARVMTDYGVVELDGDRAILLNRAKKRRDGQPDLRFNDGKIANFIIRAAMDRAKRDFEACAR